MPAVIEALKQVMARRDLSRAQAGAVLRAIFAEEASESQIAALLVGLAMKGEAVDEIVGFAEVMRAAVADIGLNGRRLACVDTCGTGGNLRQTFNVSTAAAFVAAGAGVAVAKHGNRTSTSLCGSADVLEAAGVNLAMGAERLGDCLETVGIVFLFAPLLHSAMRQVMPARRALQVRTIFNLLGPLTNPAAADAQVIGVASREAQPKLAEALCALGTRHSFVVRSRDGLGEFSTTGLNDVLEIRAGRIESYSFDAGDLGLARAQLADFSVASREQAVEWFHGVLAGEAGPRRDLVCLNAAAALIAGERARDWAEGLELARQAIDSGAARGKLAALVSYSQSPGSAAGRAATG